MITQLLGWFLKQYVGSKLMLPFGNQQQGGELFPPWMGNVMNHMFTGGNQSRTTQKGTPFSSWPFGQVNPFWMTPEIKQHPFVGWPFSAVSWEPSTRTKKKQRKKKHASVKGIK